MESASGFESALSEAEGGADAARMVLEAIRLWIEKIYAAVRLECPARGSASCIEGDKRLRGCAVFDAVEQDNVDEPAVVGDVKAEQIANLALLPDNLPRVDIERGNLTIAVNQ